MKSVDLFRRKSEWRKFCEYREGENMEWMGLVALGLVLCYSEYPGKVKRLEATVKRLERKQRGENAMSKVIEELVGKDCKIKTENALQLVGSEELLCHVLDADDEWIKVSYVDKKKNQITKLLRIEYIEEVEEIEEV